MKISLVAYDFFRYRNCLKGENETKNRDKGVKTEKMAKPCEHLAVIT